MPVVPAVAPSHVGRRARPRLCATVDRADLAVPCRRADPDLWFAVSPVDLERAKKLCRRCPIRAGCLAGALQRQEPWGVWGGEILDRGTVIAHKRPRGRPPRSAPAGSG